MKIQVGHVYLDRNGTQWVVIKKTDRGQYDTHPFLAHPISKPKYRQWFTPDGMYSDGHYASELDLVDYAM